MSQNSKTDLTFFTNEPGHTLLDRFIATLKGVQFFDIIVGYFRITGFYQLYESLEPVERIRILVGLSVDRKTHELILESGKQQELDFESSKRTKQILVEYLRQEMDGSEDNHNTQVRVKRFIQILS